MLTVEKTGKSRQSRQITVSFQTNDKSQMPKYQCLSVVWERDSLDWKDLTAPDITKRITTKVRDGSIILFHNAAKHTPEALPGIIEYLISEGYQIVPVSELLLDGAYDIDNTGRMIADAGA